MADCCIDEMEKILKGLEERMPHEKGHSLFFLAKGLRLRDEKTMRVVFEEGVFEKIIACISAAFLAFADTGIPMRGIVTSVTSSSVDGVPVVDISSREEMDTVPRVTVCERGGGEREEVELATVGGRDEVVLVEMEKAVHVDHLLSLVDASQQACASIHSCLHASLQQHLSQIRALL